MQAHLATCSLTHLIMVCSALLLTCFTLSFDFESDLVGVRRETRRRFNGLRGLLEIIFGVNFEFLL